MLAVWQFKEKAEPGRVRLSKSSAYSITLGGTANNA
ncbi:hypothetical protein QE382_002949 [Sphingobacterium zeae]|uniref:Uncharacterized protein n=1 Tax=Sphingobacterium zeae TaxID=1776859 RepID=A0ABU0U7M6_9SPHI|nr:hypothetical protein [Sphingobacterium zeae]